MAPGRYVGKAGEMHVLHKMDSDIVAHPSLLLVDDNPALLETLIEMLEPAYRVAATLCSGASVVEEVTVLSPDLVILDVSLGDLNGFEVARRLKDTDTPVKIIFLSVHENIDFVNAAFSVGAAGYVFKSRITADLVKAIDLVFHGGQFASVNSQTIH
jgi:DNA-binding NarL/FixJ family response regulator